MSSSRGLRGGTLEELITLTNDKYRRQKLACVQKVPTPITPVEICKESRTIKLAYFEKRSTVDFMGAVQGIPICFDAKETRLKNLPIANIHSHQIEFMEDFTAQGGIAFMLVHFTVYDEYFFLSLDALKPWWQQAQAGGRKSIPYENFDQTYRIANQGGAFIHYLEAISTFLSEQS